MLKALLVPVVYVDFKLNQDYIAKVLCINRDTPELQCNGHCVLMKKMQQAQGSDDPAQNQQKERRLIEFICYTRDPFHFINEPSFLETPFAYSSGPYFFNPFFTIFHPPKTA